MSLLIFNIVMDEILSEVVERTKEKAVLYADDNDLRKYYQRSREHFLVRTEKVDRAGNKVQHRKERDSSSSKKKEPRH